MRFSNEFGFYELNPFPGCNQIVVSNHAFIYPKFRGQGKGRQQHEERLQKAKDLGYDLIMCTVKADNARERHILESNGWKQCQRFLNQETDNLIVIYVKELK